MPISTQFWAATSTPFLLLTRVSWTKATHLGSTPILYLYTNIKIAGEYYPYYRYFEWIIEVSVRSLESPPSLPLSPPHSPCHSLSIHSLEIHLSHDLERCDLIYYSRRQFIATSQSDWRIHPRHSFDRSNNAASEQHHFSRRNRLNEWGCPPIDNIMPQVSYQLILMSVNR